MSLQYKFFSIPVRDEEESEAELNLFLRSVRVVHVSREFVAQGENSFWALAIEYLPKAVGPSDIADRRKRSKVDYKALLSPQDFTIFAKLREWRKTVATEEGVPVYAIFTNEQLAKIAEAHPQTKAQLAEIEGVGKSRLTKYAGAVIDIVAHAEKAPAEKDGE